MPEVAGDAALLVDPTSINAIAQAMLCIWEEPRLRQQLIEAGRVERQRYSWAETARLVYEQLLRLANTNR
jgi:glycosyltransferase involved in cell wall biosynthesis